MKSKTSKTSFTFALTALFLTGCGFPTSQVDTELANDRISEKLIARCCSGRAYRAKATAYYPDDSKMQGGYVDRKGARLRTLQDFLDGDAKYVSVALDAKAFPYGKQLCIPELEEYYDKKIPFRVVDTGAAFKGKGTSRIDICVRNRKASLKRVVNQRITFVACD